MDMQDLISVVVPVHNGQEFLRENIECILNQTHTNLEIIYVCDRCTDNTIDILQGYAVIDTRLKIIIGSEVNGAAASRNLGMKSAHGEWAIFLDSDDLFELDMIEIMLGKALKEKADLCCCFWEEFDEEPSTNILFSNTIQKLYCKTYPIINVKNEMKHILQLASHVPWNKLIHNSLLRKKTVYFQEIPNANDVYFSFSVTAEAAKIVYVDAILVHYRCSEGRNVLSEKRKNSKNYVWQAYDQFYQYIEQKDDNLELKQSFYNRVCMGISSLVGCVLYENLFKELRDTYLIRWGMQDHTIQKKLSYFNQEVYLKLCAGDMSLNKDIMTKRAIERFICNIAEMGGCSIWGCGYLFHEYLENVNLANIGIQHLFDSDPNKWGKTIAGIIVEKFDIEWVECIIVTSPQYFDEIREQIGDRAGRVIDLEKEIFMY